MHTQPMHEVLAEAIVGRHLLTHPFYRRWEAGTLAEGELAVNDLVERLEIVQPLVSKHLRVLREVGLVEVRESGRQRFYRLNGVSLKPIHDWVKNYESSWSERFGRLDVLLEELKDKEREDGNRDR